MNVIAARILARIFQDAHFSGTVIPGFHLAPWLPFLQVLTFTNEGESRDRH